ncbi:hypothetical protein [Neolewinella antarctica]|uniref:Flap endonuclease-1-like 5' DNA nuclease/FtsZ-binding cell division protein ZapB n=1 Tax=Neolewinella antarctica TaxID=442734 RepID=A0ABX0XHS9_9BACT|nr:hypothetical protein [Neolewinella antarctica]NJC28393.1 putative flap endonuclease-1-like 5' DNA nuclease/FtsZ-binding cell division protein ZapB [Neolewinella antarctica]
MNVFFDRIANFFVSLPPDLAILLAIIGVVIFTLGLILGWLIQRRATRRFRQEVLSLQGERDLLSDRNARLEEEKSSLGREIDLIKKEKTDALERIQTLEREGLVTTERNVDLSSQVEALEVSNQTYASTIESLNNQVIGLKTQNEQLKGRTSGSADDQEGQGGPSYDDPFLAPYPNNSVPATAPNLSDLERRLDYLENRMASLAEEREFTARIAAPNAQSNDAYGSWEPVATDAEGEPLVIRADTTEAGVRVGHAGNAKIIVQTTPSLHTPLTPAEDEIRDDLTRIRRIGDFLQNQLNAVDVYRYEQIAAWAADDIVNYTELIGYLPGAIERDDWVGQARQLVDADDVADDTGAEG